MQALIACPSGYRGGANGRPPSPLPSRYTINRVLIDGKAAVKTEKVVFRGSGGRDTQIRQLLFSTFHGGQKPRWAPVDKEGNPTTVHALFDNFKVTNGIQDTATDADHPRR